MKIFLKIAVGLLVVREIAKSTGWIKAKRALSGAADSMVMGTARKGESDGPLPFSPEKHAEWV